MKEVSLQVEDGLVAYTINDRCRVVFNPADVGFVGKLSALAETLGDIQTETETRIKADGPEAVFDATRKADAEMRERIDGLLGEGTCASLWGDLNAYALAGGLPLWANLIFALLDTCDAGITAQQALTRPRLEKYTKKYHK